jgi:hypothetical protein
MAMPPTAVRGAKHRTELREKLKHFTLTDTHLEITSPSTGVQADKYKGRTSEGHSKAEAQRLLCGTGTHAYTKVRTPQTTRGWTKLGPSVALVCAAIALPMALPCCGGVCVVLELVVSCWDPWHGGFVLRRSVWRGLDAVRVR